MSFPSPPPVSAHYQPGNDAVTVAAAHAAIPLWPPADVTVTLVSAPLHVS
jgi:hypothetical protein